MVHGRTELADRIRLMFDDEEEWRRFYEELGPAFGSWIFYKLEVLIEAYKSDAACRRYTKSTIGSASNCIDYRGRGMLALFDEFWDGQRLPNETPLQVAERMTVDLRVHVRRAPRDVGAFRPRGAHHRRCDAAGARCPGPAPIQVVNGRRGASVAEPKGSNQNQNTNRH